MFLIHPKRTNQHKRKRKKEKASRPLSYCLEQFDTDGFTEIAVFTHCNKTMNSTPQIGQHINKKHTGVVLPPPAIDSMTDKEITFYTGFRLQQSSFKRYSY